MSNFKPACYTFICSRLFGYMVCFGFCLHNCQGREPITPFETPIKFIASGLAFSFSFEHGRLNQLQRTLVLSGSTCLA